ncbi:MAG TPA: gliding motility-associated C-terminal domain-containing protein [Brumimicrobium sp.]|nr:gliding motility-associated C-terminal domain-containing protein [Brumimicrobium sp.]
MYRYLILLFITLLFQLVKGQEVNHEHSIYHAFIENKGQWGNNVFFKNNVEGGNMWVEQGRVIFQIQDYSMMRESHFVTSKMEDKELTYKEKLIELRFVDALKVAQVEKKGATEHYYNYFIGNDESKWASEVRGYEEFTLKNLYEGIDIRFVEQEKQIKYEFIVGPNIEPNKIKLEYSFQKELKIDRNGNLVIKTELGNIIEERPYAYQIVNGKILEIPCSYELVDNVVTFKLGEYNKRVELIIDPTLVFATYNGAISDNFGMTATYGYDGTAYIAGTVYGNGYPMPDTDAYNPTSNFTSLNVGVVTTDIFITKYSSDGTAMLWSTFFGGGDNTQGTEAPNSLICDMDNNLYLYGTTSSLDFPTTTSAFQQTHGGGTPWQSIYNGINYGVVGSDIFVSKFSSDGHQLLASTYVGGSENDGVNYTVTGGSYNGPHRYDSLTTNYGDQFRGEIMLDENKNVIVGSCTRSGDFPTQSPFQAAIGGRQDGVVFKLTNDLSTMMFSSFYGGENNDAIYSIKVDSSYNVVFAGGTNSVSLPMSATTYQPTHNGGKAEGFIAKLTPNGHTLSHSTYLGTSNYDQVYFIEIDRQDRIFALGQSYGGSFPVINAAYSNPNSSQFIARFSPDLTTIEASTVFGSGNAVSDISPSAFLVDICGNIYVSGWGGSVLPGANSMGGMPVSANAYQTTPPNGFDFYLMVIEREFAGLLYGTYMGGASAKEHMDGGTSRFDKNGVVYQAVCGGCGGYSDFPTTPGAWSSQNLSTNCNALTFKFDFDLIPHAEFTIDNAIGCAPFVVNFENFSSDSDSYKWDFGNGDIDSTTFEPTITYTTPGVYNVMLTVLDSICLISDTAFLTIEVYPELILENIPDVNLCEPETITLTADANGTATSFVWSTNTNFTDTLNLSLSDSTAIINEPVEGYYYVKALNNGCSVIDSVLINFTSASLSLDGITNLCLDDETMITASSNDVGVSFINFDWSEDSIIVSGQGTASVRVKPTVTQYLTVTAIANNGCIVNDSILISVSDIDASSVVASASETNVPIGTDIVLSAEPSGYTYSWSPSEGVNNPNAQETGATVIETTNYIVSVSDGICTKMSSIGVVAFPYTCEEPFIFVPNAFTPNGDGENDVLYLRSVIVQDVIFKIFNRWGELVFETTSLHKGWDGTFRGKQLAPDVYDYYLEGHCIDGQEFLIKGNITLIR